MTSMVAKSIELEPELLADIAAALRVLAHPQRLRISDAIHRLGEVPVHVLVEAVRLPQAVVSHHLAQLRRTGLVAAHRHGREVWYGLSDPHAVTILDCVRKKHCELAGTARRAAASLRKGKVRS